MTLDLKLAQGAISRALHVRHRQLNVSVVQQEVTGPGIIWDIIVVQISVSIV